MIDPHDLFLDLYDIRIGPVHDFEDLGIFSLVADELVGNDLPQIMEKSCDEGIFGRGRKHLVCDGLGTYRTGYAVLPEFIEIQCPFVLFVEQIDDTDAQDNTLEHIESEEHHCAPDCRDLLYPPVKRRICDLEHLYGKGLILFHHLCNLPGVNLCIKGLLHDRGCD